MHQFITLLTIGWVGFADLAPEVSDLVEIDWDGGSDACTFFLLLHSTFV